MKNDQQILLNLEQNEAVEYNKGPLLIVAGAGTGKTLVLVEKIKYLIKNNSAKPEEILALTFTEKAAAEMEERVDVAMPYGYFQMWISTFHSFADQILREEISHIGLSSAYKLLTEAETIIFMRENLFLFNLRYFSPRGNPNKFLEALLQHFSRLKDEDVSPEQYLEWAKSHFASRKAQSYVGDKEEKEKSLELAKAYDIYQKVKIKEGYFDFSDLIYYLLRLFEQRKNILQKYQKQFKYILVDEFQDTNIAQYLLVKLLCPSKTNPKLTVVGDDSQAIYKFRGASVSNILTFMKDYKNAKQITLRKNYRSGQQILDASYKLIKNNDPDTLEAQLGISKYLTAEDQTKDHPVNFFLAETVEEEASYVANEILKLKKDYKYSDFAILIRANTHADPFVRALSQKGIPYQFMGPGMLFKQPEVKDLIAYLQVLADIDDSVSFYRVLSMDIFNLDKKDLSYLLSFSKKISRSLFQAIEISLGFFSKEIYQQEFEIYKKFLPFIKSETKQTLLTIYKMIKRHLGLVRKETGGQILYYFLEDAQLLNQLANYKTEKEERIALNISKFFNKLKRFESDHEDASVFAIVDYIRMSMELGESPTVSETDIPIYDAVNILTVHGAKGLEFPFVFLINLVKGRFPTYERKEAVPIPQELIKEILPKGDYHPLEERRLFYVGLTRAMEQAYLTASLTYGSGKREAKISPFVIETLGEDFIKKQQTLKKDDRKQLSIFNFKKEEEKIIKKDFVLNNFSFSQIDTFLTCPLQYKYQYVLRIPFAKNFAAAFGETIHKTLEKFYQEFITNRKIGLARLLDIYQQSWIPLGYSSKPHEQRVKKDGAEILKSFYKKFHNSKTNIIDLERLFKIKITSDISLTGKIDRVDKVSENEIEVIDYKTGRKPDDKEIQNSLQLSIYLLAATNEGLYKKKVNQVKLTFFYLDSLEKISMEKTQADVEETKQQIIKTVEDIRRSEFNPRVGPWCDFCPFKMICEAWQ